MEQNFNPGLTLIGLSGTGPRFLHNYVSPSCDQVMFETFDVPDLYMATQQVLAFNSAGRTTGLVFDSEDGVSHAVQYIKVNLLHLVLVFALNWLVDTCRPTTLGVY